MTEKHKIVVVGGGVAGLDLASHVSGKPARKLGWDVRLVDRELAHVWKPMLHTIAAGTADTGAHQTAYLSQARRRGFSFELGEVVAVDRERSLIRIGPVMATGEEVLPARSLQYDTLVLAAGSRANDFGTPGVAEHCMTIDSRREALAFNDRLRIALIRSVASQRPLSVAVVGAGATGVELVAELIRLADVLELHGALGLRGNLSITLIESQDRILGPFPPKVAQAALEVLERLGITVLMSARVQSADDTGFALADGRRVDADLKLWAAGVRAPAFIADIEGLQHSRLGQVIVDRTLMAVGDPKILALGDCASVQTSEGEAPLPTTAQAAYQQCMYLCRHLPAIVQGLRVPDFRYHDFGSLVSLGGYDAYGTLARFGLFEGGFLRGRVAQLGHSLLYRRHQTRLYGPLRGSLLWLVDILDSHVRSPGRFS
ncbi:FAD-dependent oxidoreductase [Sphingobium sp. H39-3-25]|nr:FAD-dependent oxidoreductase [Sphingobium arseniciresistens]